ETPTRASARSTKAPSSPDIPRMQPMACFKRASSLPVTSDRIRFAARFQLRAGVVQSTQSDSLPVALADTLKTPGSLPVFFRNLRMLLLSGADHSGRIEQCEPFWTSE